MTTRSRVQRSTGWPTTWRPALQAGRGAAGATPPVDVVWCDSLLTPRWPSSCFAQQAAPSGFWMDRVVGALRQLERSKLRRVLRGRFYDFEGTGVRCPGALQRAIPLAAASASSIA